MEMTTTKASALVADRRAVCRSVASFARPARRTATHVVKFKEIGKQATSHQATTAKLLSRRGYAATEPNKPLSPFTHSVGELGPSEIDIKVTHNGLCHTDIHMAINDWGVSAFPFVPGHEVVGIVAATGRDVTGLRAGDRVGVGWISNSCRCCSNCIRGNDNLCEKGYTGLCMFGQHGGFQETCRVQADFAHKIPDGLDSASAAPLLCAGITVYAPLRAHVTRPNMSVAVMGVGGLGHLALQYARKMGAEVTAISGRPEKEKECREFGAHNFMIWNKDNAAYKSKFDIIINTASSDVSTTELMALLKVDGSLVQVGIPGGGASMTVNLQDLVFNQKKVVGSIVGGRADMKEMLEFSAVHGVKPLVETMPLSKVNEAMQHVLSGKARYRVVLTSDWE
ncbi:hypothetical protein CHLRE_14g623650v5 [Chlamydomonas reinhardtii]|uniref:alcohol dehydrogenase (NADP(+)) n=1 Tax=Chlamydomonas reinhardtii TaxID=3055 RepID=A0A2K3CY66_CHLRE|nr:uncharacterized protein CHLRE_14g623650v5 [Chlamydomonas reinhardtii]PNW73221.1 hypothetical protein CHLRE_14g623650v5 [Chlamydomonas reinhardtii]